MSAATKSAVLDLAHVRERTELHLRGLEAISLDLTAPEAIKARAHSKRLEAAYQSVLSARADLQLALRDLDQLVRKP